MVKYSSQTRKRRVPRRVWILLLIIILFTFVGTVVVRQSYYNNLRAVSGSTQKQYITIKSGATVNEIANQLKEAQLIRSSRAFEWYVSIHNYRDKLQAGTYGLMSSQTTSAIADTIASGKVATDLVTILPAQRLDQIRQAFISSGFSAESVDAALDANQYRADFPALADNPPNSSLEGFLYPDSYQKTADTDPKQIVMESLGEMQKHLTTDIRKGFAQHSLTVYQGVTLASIVEQEVSNQTDRDQVAQVFLTRLQTGMPLGSDPTAFYGAIKSGVAPALNYDSPYNTLIHKGLPPGPINAVSSSSLSAVAYPASTDWLYFVSGDDGVTHFAKTYEQHQANINQYCHKLCNTTQ